MSILRANVLTPFNLILAAFGVVTLIFGDPRDALFLAVLVANSLIGISQEVRAKRALDRLSLLVAPEAMVKRDGSVHPIAIEELVVGDLVLLAAGDQVAADGTLEAAQDLRLDESILTGESEAIRRGEGDAVRSGAFVVEGTGAFRVTAVGPDSFAGRVTGQARSFRHPRSPLESAVNRLLYVMAALVVGLGAILGFSLYHRHVPLHTAIATATAGVGTMIPEGLVVLISLTYAVAAARMSRRGVLAQQLNAIESLASVDTICVDKTGTLTEASLRVVDILPGPGVEQPEVQQALATLAGGASGRNITLQAIADTYPKDVVPAVIAEVPFSSWRRWSAVQTTQQTLYLGAPGRIPTGQLRSAAEHQQNQGRRVLAIARGRGPLPTEPAQMPPAGLIPLGLVVLAEQLRPNISATIAFLREQNVEIKVLSGDDPRTVAAIARDVGLPVAGVSDESALPNDPDARQRFAAHATVVGRVSPDGKQAIIQALRDQGRYVVMIGDGVNDVPALKTAQLAIAQGNGSQMARAVSDLVLVSGDFASIPILVAEGRRALRNLQRVTKLYVTKSALAAFLILTIGTSSEAYPLLPRHLSLAGTLTLGLPTLVLALAPSSGAWRPEHFASTIGRFAVPAGAILAAGLVAAYLFARHDLDLSIPAARTVALTSLIAGGLYLVMALEAGGSRRRSTLVAGMCVAMAGLYATVLSIPAARVFFAVSSPSPGMLVAALIAGAMSIGALALAGFSTRTASPPSD
ncbi:MAG: HAD-IC family P-type ATPase [Solirubrobacteraceae bacterium]